MALYAPWPCLCARARAHLCVQGQVKSGLYYKITRLSLFSTLTSASRFRFRPALLLWTVRRNQRAALICSFFCCAHEILRMEAFRPHGHFLETNNLSASEVGELHGAMADIWECSDSVAASLLPLNWWMKTKTFRLSGSLEWWGTIDDICASVRFFPSALISHCVTSLSNAGPTVGMMEMLHSNLISCPVMHLTFQRPKLFLSILILRCIF